MEHINSRKRLGVKLLNIFWNYKDFSLKLLHFNKQKSLSRNIIKGIISLEVASFIYFKLFKFTSNNDTINNLFNHEENKSYFINILSINLFGKYLAITYPHLFKRVLISGAICSIPVTQVNKRLSTYIEDKLKIDNFEVFSETNMLPKLILSTSLVQFLNTFISDKFWSLSLKGASDAFKFNRKTIMLTLNIVLIAKFTQFLSMFLSEDIK